MSYGSPSGQVLRTTSNGEASGGRRAMADWEKQIFAINLIVGVLERSKTFYREVFGLAPLDEEEDLAIFRFKETYVALRHDPAHQAASADEVLRLAQKGVGQFAIVVEDVDAVHAELEA